MTLQHDHAMALLRRARDDLYIVQRLIEDPNAPAWVLGFHAQQAVEKALKGALSFAGSEYPRTHNLDMLSQLIKAAGLTPPPCAADLGVLTPFGVVLRYEDAPTEECQSIATTQLLRLAEEVISWARQLIDPTALVTGP
ncbi:MAG: HEPN domain-containing protein [Rubrivivax sp.]